MAILILIIQIIILIFPLIIHIISLKKKKFSVKEIKEIPKIEKKDEEFEALGKIVKVSFKLFNSLEIFEIKAHITEKFINIWKNLKLKYNILEKYKIKYVKYSNELLLSEFIKSHKTLKEINYKEETYFEIIPRSENEILSVKIENEIIAKPEKYTLKIKIKYLKNAPTYEIEVSNEDTFNKIFDSLKKECNDLNYISLDDIICYQIYNGISHIIINGKNDYNKQIDNLDINLDEIIFIESNKNSKLDIFDSPLKKINHNNNKKGILDKKVELKFVHVNIDNDIYRIEIFKKNSFLNVINLLKEKNQELNDVYCNEIYVEKNGKKKYLISNENDLNKKIEDVLTKEDEIDILYINGDFIDSFNLQLFWVNRNNQKFEFKVGKKEQFHKAILKFQENNDIFESYTITKIYMKNDLNKKINLNTENNNLINVYVESDDKIIDTKMKKERFYNYEKNENIKLIEHNITYKYESFQDLNINENSKIFFETKKTIDNQGQFENISENNENVYLIFQFNQKPYPLTVHVDTKFKDVIADFKKKYPNFKNKEIKIAMIESKNLCDYEFSFKTIKDLELKNDMQILLY